MIIIVIILTYFNSNRNSTREIRNWNKRGIEFYRNRLVE